MPHVPIATSMPTIDGALIASSSISPSQSPPMSSTLIGMIAPSRSELFQMLQKHETSMGKKLIKKSGNVTYATYKCCHETCPMQVYTARVKGTNRWEVRSIIEHSVECPNVSRCAYLIYIYSGYVMLCYVMLCYVMLCYVMSCYVMLCHVMSCYVMLCYVMLCYVYMSTCLHVYMLLS
eukprot:SAG31_NODE_591_length_13740_cov_11.032256_2_plen_178_part_00